MTAIDLDTRIDLDQALCRQTDPELFFPGVGGDQTAQKAKRICASCTQAAVCLEEALARREQFGVWGGTTERERARLLRRRAA